MEKRTIIILIIALIIAAILLFIFLQGGIENKDNLTGNEIKATEQEAEDNGDESVNSGSSGAGGGSGSGSGGAGSSGASGSGVTGGASEGEIQLPSDLYDVECGYYFSEFGVCAGICPSGKCTEEGRSCYCKKA